MQKTLQIAVSVLIYRIRGRNLTHQQNTSYATGLLRVEKRYEQTSLITDSLTAIPAARSRSIGSASLATNVH